MVCLQTTVSNLTAAITKGGLSGTVGQLDISDLDVDGLSAAVKVVEDVGCKSTEAQKLLVTAKQVKKLRTAVASDTWAVVASILEESREMMIADAAVPEFLLVQDELDNRAMVSQLLAALESGGAVGEVGDINTATVDVTALDRYVEAAQIPLPFPFWHWGGCPLLR